MSNYTNALQIDAQESTVYYNYSLDNKTEQQKSLEQILRAKGVVPQVIADIACGGGGAKCASCRFVSSGYIHNG